MGFKGTNNQIKVVKLLLTEEITKTMVAKKVKVANNTISYMLGRFDANGMLEFRPNLNDMRGDLVTLSDNFIRKYFGSPIMKPI